MNRFKVKTVTKADRDAEAEAVAVLMLTEALGSLPSDRAISALSALLRDDPRMTPDDLERLSNDLGREAHERARGQHA